MAQEFDDSRRASKAGHDNGSSDMDQLAQNQERRPLNSVDIFGPHPANGARSTPAPIRLQPDHSAGLPPIGTAELLPDETLILHLRAESADGKTHGDGEIKVTPKDKDYSSIRGHIGEIKEGEIKFVSPWVDSTGLPTNSTPVKGDVVPESGTAGGTKPNTGNPTIDNPPAGNATGGGPNANGIGKPPAVADPIVPPSANFNNEVTTTYNAMSAETRAIITKSGAKVVAVHHLTDAMPELKGQAPRGWPVGATWDAVDGCWSASKNSIVVAEERQQISGNQWIPSGRVREVMRHETGHAVDGTIKTMSDHTDFKKAYDDDLAAMPTGDKNQLAYFLQNGSAGREETAAEGVADREGGATGGAAFHRDFSRTLKVINDTIVAAAALPGNSTIIAAPGGGAGLPQDAPVTPKGEPAVPKGEPAVPRVGPATPLRQGTQYAPVQTY